MDGDMVTDHPDFDESRLVRELEEAPCHLRAAFAAACAERLYSAYLPFEGGQPRGDPGEVRALLDRLWRELEVGETQSAWAAEAAEWLNAISPLEDDEDDQPTQGWAEADDFCEALFLALMSHATGSAEKAAHAGSVAYEAVCVKVPGEAEITVFSPGAYDPVIEHPFVQAELRRQRLDLAELKSAGDVGTVVRRLRECARSEGLAPD
jgi:uncharacterized protein YjaG (DUF416 family)